MSPDLITTVAAALVDHLCDRCATPVPARRGHRAGSRTGADVHETLCIHWDRQPDDDPSDPPICFAHDDRSICHV